MKTLSLKIKALVIFPSVLLLTTALQGFNLTLQVANLTNKNVTILSVSGTVTKTVGVESTRYFMMGSWKYKEYTTQTSRLTIEIQPGGGNGCQESVNPAYIGKGVSVNPGAGIYITLSSDGDSFTPDKMLLKITNLNPTKEITVSPTSSNNFVIINSTNLP